jgi:hypothetical protein
MLRLFSPARMRPASCSDQISYFCTQPSRDMTKTKRPSAENFGPPWTAKGVSNRSSTANVSPSSTETWLSPVSTTSVMFIGSAVKTGAMAGE